MPLRYFIKQLLLPPGILLLLLLAAWWLRRSRPRLAGVCFAFGFGGLLLMSLPVVVQWIGWISPLWHATELGRQFSYGPTEPIWVSALRVLYLVVLGVAGWMLTVRVATKRLQK